ncbi:MAG TPA: urease accessory protein UreD [Pseudonocardiaceae bacterium]|nr:urease accessory protein UreD [Pseudonocardiaceae bacterium]
MKAQASLDVEPASLRWHDCAPIALRPTGPGQVHLIQAAGGPLGGDELGLDLAVAADAEIEVRSAAATVVQPGPDGEPAHWSMRADTAGALRWWPEPTVVCANADYRARLTVDLATGARLILREQVILGRVGEKGGRYRGRLTVRVAGVPLVDTETVLDGADTALSGPAGSAGFRVFGSVLVVGPDLPKLDESAHVDAGVRSAVLPLDGPGYLLLALGDTAAAVDLACSRSVCSGSW